MESFPKRANPQLVRVFEYFDECERELSRSREELRVNHSRRDDLERHLQDKYTQLDQNSENKPSTDRLVKAIETIKLQIQSTLSTEKEIKGMGAKV